MAEEESIAVLTPVIPLPIALYDSNGLVFELYQGGQPYRHHLIVWERLKPIEEEAPPGASVEQNVIDCRSLTTSLTTNTCRN